MCAIKITQLISAIIATFNYLSEYFDLCDEFDLLPPFRIIDMCCLYRTVFIQIVSWAKILVHNLYMYLKEIFKTTSITLLKL